MTVTVDTPALRRRFRERSGRQKLGGVDVWVELNGVDRSDAHEAVTTALAELVPDPDSSTHAAPTSGGTYVWLEVGDGWPDLVGSLAARLETRRLSGTITVPPTTTSAELFSRRFAPAAVLGFSLDPSLERGPFNQVGGPEIRWGVGAEAQAAVLQEACTWAVGRTTAWAGDILHVPLTPEDCTDVLDQLLGRRQSVQVRQLARTPAPGEKGAELLRRTISFESFGRSGWSNADPAVSVQEGLEDLVALITRLAPHLDVATLGPALPTSISHGLVTGRYRQVRHRWDTYVPDAACVQLLTDRHLERAGDLSAWRVEEVAPGRHLVQWERWQDWFAEPHPRTGHVRPDPDALARARHDFADLVATKEVVQANRLVPPS